MLPRLLLVDDDIPARTLLQVCLEKQGFAVAGATDADEMRAEMERSRFDLVLLDINLPAIDGLTLAREIRQQSHIGIIMLTARDGHADRIAGLEWGADDYVTKNAPVSELIARIRALLRRTGWEASKPVNGGASPLPSPPPVPTIRHFGDWKLDPEAPCLVSPSGESVPLTRGELDLMTVLVNTLGKAVSRANLLAAVSSKEWSGTERSIDVMIGRLRRKLGDDPRRPKALQTVHGIGYRLIGEAITVPVPAARP